MTELLAGVALAVSLLALALAYRAWRPRRRTDGSDFPDDLLGLRREVAALRAEAADGLRNLAVVRYDAFEDMGGRLSWTLVLVDDDGDGVLLTCIHGRSESRTYAKGVSGFGSAVELSPEEEEALKQARNDA